MSFGRLRDKGYESRAEINMVPLIDIMLVLLVIFILTAPLVTQSVKLKLPEAVDLKEEVVVQDPEKPVLIAINADNELFINDEAIDFESALPRLTAIKEGSEKAPMIQLHIDSSVPYQEVAKIVTILSKVGLANIGFVSLPEEGSAQP
ncbi:MULTISPECIES: ExbD/TolR family protein [Ignatzschineria]|uniref:Biopolymer transporter ExbD n=1 Tax=Ignatzschineria cameli TaxID=2182793 RepID=A0A2U2AJH9_9GAMM|nr:MULTISPECIES: biopolymer transporter ExbD [Ignatzschineria]OYQ79346.1 biopolymer transporter ExbD [Ignatzschineria sp. F8392]PWD82816.1 biopolymer transporter ExbD [Ignatzschineria cameli]PWD85680.1 biopolymer transporter ExbD [Ignatzschineria cameli]PWD86803.1 biopolymer transporter ExbD [Ignatzschineria cameli]PWD88444.1 biopolymer transporter ExbD [Ignatzschineria cameli]